MFNLLLLVLIGAVCARTDWGHNYMIDMIDMCTYARDD